MRGVQGGGTSLMSEERDGKGLTQKREGIHEEESGAEMCLNLLANL